MHKELKRKFIRTVPQLCIYKTPCVMYSTTPLARSISWKFGAIWPTKHGLGEKEVGEREEREERETAHDSFPLYLWPF